MDIAKNVDLVAVAEHLGYTVKRIGRYQTLLEMDSIRIYDNKSWFRWSRQYDKGENGGSQIDFLRVFAGMEIKDAVSWLLNFAGYHQREGDRRETKIAVVKKTETIDKANFILPEPAKNNNNLYFYLGEKRGISKDVIDYFVKSGLIYESSQYHNIVFKGNDVKGNTRFASMRGIYEEKGKGFKCDVAGNDKNYGFNTINHDSDELVVFEAAIDLMSYTEIWNDFKSNKIALGMLSDAPLVTFLKEHPKIKKIRFCLDNDEPGKRATNELKEKYKVLGYNVTESQPPSKYKDYNEWLVGVKKILNES